MLNTSTNICIPKRGSAKMDLGQWVWRVPYRKAIEGRERLLFK